MIVSVSPYGAASQVGWLCQSVSDLQGTRPPASQLHRLQAARYLLTGVCHAVAPRFPGRWGLPGNGGHDGVQAGSSVHFLPLSPARRTPHAIAAFHKPAHRHHHIPSHSASPKTSTTILTNRLGICQPRCLVPPIAPQRRSSPQSLAPLSPSGILDREDGEGRGAKDTAGVHPRRLRRPHLGPRCRSRYVIALGPPSSPTPSPLGLVCTRARCCWKLSLASPAAKFLSSQQPSSSWPLAAPAAGCAP